MTAEPTKSNWNFETLFAYFTDLSNERERRTDERFAALKEATTLALAATEKGTQLALAAAKEETQKAEIATEKRFEGVNEFRAALADAQQNFADRSQTDFRLSAIEKRIEKTEDSILTTGGRTQGIGAYTGIIFQVLTLVVSIAAIVLVLMRN